MSSENRNPTPNTSCDPVAASWRIAASRSAPSPVSSVWYSIPSVRFALSSPAYAASLNDLSPRPPTSNTSPTLRAAAAGLDSGAFLAHAPSGAARRASASAACAIRGCAIGASGWDFGLGRPGAAAEVVTAPAAGLVEVGPADHHPPGALHLAICAVRGRTTDHADRERLGDVLGHRQQLGHGLERPAGVVLVEPGDD